jgi:hypothetical protein
MTQKPYTPRTLTIPASLISTQELYRLRQKAIAEQESIAKLFGPEEGSDIFVFIAESGDILAMLPPQPVEDDSQDGDLSLYNGMNSAFEPVHHAPADTALEALSDALVRQSQRAVRELQSEEIPELVSHFDAIPPKIMAQMLLAFIGGFTEADKLNPKNLTAIRASCDFAEVLGPDWADIIEDFFSKVATIA